MQIAGYKIIEALSSEKTAGIDKERLLAEIQSYLKSYIQFSRPSSMLSKGTENAALGSPDCPINPIRLGSFVEPNGSRTESDSSVTLNCDFPSASQKQAYSEIINTINQQFVQWNMPLLQISNQLEQTPATNPNLNVVVSACEVLPNQIAGYNRVSSIPNQLVVGERTTQLAPFDKYVFIHELMHFFGSHPHEVTSLQFAPKELVQYMCQANDEGNRGSSLIYDSACTEFGSPGNFNAMPTGLGGVDLALIRNFYSSTAENKELDFKNSSERILAEIAKMPPDIQSKSATYFASAVCGTVFESLSSYAVAKSDLSPAAKNILFKAISTLGMVLRMAMVLGSIQDKKILAMIGTRQATQVSQTLKALVGLLHAVGLGATFYSLLMGSSNNAGRIALQSWLGTLMGKMVGELLISATGVGRERPKEYHDRRAEDLSTQPDFLSQQVGKAVNALPAHMQQVFFAMNHLDEKMASWVQQSLGMGVMTTTKPTEPASPTQHSDIELGVPPDNATEHARRPSAETLQILDNTLHDTSDHEVTSAVREARLAAANLH